MLPPQYPSNTVSSSLLSPTTSSDYYYYSRPTTRPLNGQIIPFIWWAIIFLAPAVINLNFYCVCCKSGESRWPIHNLSIVVCTHLHYSSTERIQSFHSTIIFLPFRNGDFFHLLCQIFNQIIYVVLDSRSLTDQCCVRCISKSLKLSINLCRHNCCRQKVSWNACR